MDDALRHKAVRPVFLLASDSGVVLSARAAGLAAVKSPDLTGSHYEPPSPSDMGNQHNKQKV